MEASDSVETNCERIEQVKKLMLKNGRTKLAMAWDDTQKVEELRGEVERILADTDIQMAIHLPIKGIQASKGRVLPTKATQAAEKTQTVRPKRTTPDIITVKKTEAMTYAKTLKDIKEDLISKGLVNNVHAVRETKKGDILITLGKTAEGNEKVRAALTEKLGKTNVKSWKGGDDETTFHIKGIDAITTKEELTTAIQGETDLKNQVQINSLRPGFAGTQAAIVTVGKEMAKILSGRTQIKIGLPNCLIKERINVQNCYKCWGMGHTAKSCTGPDRSKACRNCGEEGHERNGCTAPSKCVTCGGGHPANTTRCPSFRAELRKVSGKTNDTPRRRIGSTTENEGKSTPNEWQVQRPKKVTRKVTETQEAETTPERLLGLRGENSTAKPTNKNDDIMKRRWDGDTHDK